MTGQFAKQAVGYLRSVRMSTWFLMVAMIAATVQLTAFWGIAHVSHYRANTWIYTSAADVFLLFLPYVFLRSRWRWATLLLTFGLTFLLLSNLWYLKAYLDLMPLKSYFMFDNLGTFVLQGTVDSMRWTDAWMWIPAALVFAFYFIFRKKIESGEYSRGAKWIWPLVCLIVFAGGHLKRIYKYDTRVKPGDFAPYSVAWHTQHAKYACADVYGFPVHILNELRIWIEPKRALTEPEINDIESFISAHHISADDSLSVVLRNRNRSRNLIILVAESFNAKVLGMKAAGISLTPRMDQILATDSVLLLNHVVSQVSHARSSDGQMIINTGLLPLVNQAVPFDYGDNVYYSLAKAWPGESLEVMGEAATLWNHDATSKSYGFGRYVDRIEYDSRVSGRWWAIDSLIFSEAADLLQHTKQPFYAHVIGISMHDPYVFELPGAPEALKNLDLDPRDIRYMEATYRFDNAVGEFIDNLKATGLYDNSVVAVVSDHNARPTALSPSGMFGEEVMMMVINGGVDLRYDAAVGQIDLYPTLLQLMGLTDYHWHGLGHSVLGANPPTSAVDKFGKVYGEAPDSVVAAQREAWRVADLIIRSDYFRSRKE